jgi:monoamine oxidase
LDALTIDDYLLKAQDQTKAPSWVIESIRMSYKGEFGTETNEQSAMLLIQQIGTGLRRPFEVYGPKQDESQRIRGGNSKLIEALFAVLNQKKLKFFPSHTLVKIDYKGASGRHKVYVELRHNERKKTRNFDYVVLALPFTKLREVEGLEILKERGFLSPGKYQAIQEIGYGNILKIMLGMNGEPWRNNPRFPLPTNGSFRTDNPYLQNTWITSVGQTGTDSILTILVAGHEAKQPIDTIARECRKATVHLFQMSEDQLFNHRHSSHIWSEDEYVRGSYSAFRPGQYTTLRLWAGTPECEERLGFVGEHTDPELYGYMSGAVHSATKEAERILTRIHKTSSGSADSGPGAAPLPLPNEADALGSR